MSDEIPSLEALENLIRKRRAIRHFAPTDIDHALVERLLEAARWAPSGYNLQPTRFVVVTDREIRPALQRACLNQPQVSEAPVVVIFAADHRAYEDHFEKILALDLEAGAVDEKYVKLLRRVVPIMLRRGPLRLNWLWKRLLVPVVRLAAPLPLVPAVEKRFWLGKQAMLCAMNFMLAAEAAELNTVPMEGFDTGRLRRCLKLPSSWEPMLVVPVGYRQTDGAIKTRRPLLDVSLWR